MESEVKIYLSGSLEKRILQLTQETAPFRIEGMLKEDAIYLLKAKNDALPEEFLYGHVDAQALANIPAHIRAQRELEFTPKSALSYIAKRFRVAQREAFRDVMEYLQENAITAYMTATDTYQDTLFVRGYNPHTNTRSENPHIKQRFPELF